MKFSAKNASGGNTYVVCNVQGKSTLQCRTEKVERGHDEDRQESRGDHEWTFHGHTEKNQRRAKDERKISPQSASRMGVKWTFSQFQDVHGNTVNVGDITCNPIVVGKLLYFCDWPMQSGFTVTSEAKLFCLDKETGRMIWYRQVKDIVGYGGQALMIRSSVAVSGRYLVAGTQLARPFNFLFPDFAAFMFAIDRHTGKTIWVTDAPIDPQAVPHDPPPIGNTVLGTPYPIIKMGAEYVFTGSPLIIGDRIFTGLSSWTELMMIHPHFHPSFRGREMCLDLKTGRIIWQTYMIEDNMIQYRENNVDRDARLYAGAAVWTVPAYDRKTKTLYVTTGNNYCIPGQRRQLFSEYMISFPEKGNHVDSVLALDSKTGKIKWTYSVAKGFADQWQVFCLPTSDSSDCASGPDVDYGAGPLLFKTKDGREVVGAASKSGKFTTLDRHTGYVISEIALGPLAGSIGGIHWGAAVEKGTVYAPYGYSELTRKALATASPSNGRFTAIDPILGQVKWAIENPVPDVYNGSGVLTNFGSAAVGTMAYNSPPVVANGVVFFGAANNQGTIFAIDCKTGTILWQRDTGATVYGGGSVVDGVLYWGNGYTSFGGTAGNGLTAYTPM